MHRLLHVALHRGVHGPPALRFLVRNSIVFAAEGVLKLQASLLTTFCVVLNFSEFVRKSGEIPGLSTSSTACNTSPNLLAETVRAMQELVRAAPLLKT